MERPFIPDGDLSLMPRQTSNALRGFFAAMKMANPDPLTRPAAAGESAVAGHPLPQGGEGIFMTRGEPKGHEVFALQKVGA